MVRGARCAHGPFESDYYSIELGAGRIVRIGEPRDLARASGAVTEIDLSRYLVLPGLINAHDHLHFSLYPRLGDPPYQNYVQWGEDVHHRFAETVATQHSIPKGVRLWWGGLRNLLCGVTTVCHHDTLWPELQREDFPVRVLQRYAWAHSVSLGGDLLEAYKAAPPDIPFILHACEGVDEKTAEEFEHLDRLGLLGNRTVLVHGLALRSHELETLRERRVSLIICPSSNDFLFHRLHVSDLLAGLEDVSLGSDSPLTAIGNLCDEVRFCAQNLNLPRCELYEMLTTRPAKALRLHNGEGTITTGGVGDLIAVVDRGGTPADAVVTLSLHDVELVMIGGQVQLASEALWRRLEPACRSGLEPLSVDGTIRWLRAPVQDLLHAAESVLGEQNARLSGRLLRVPTSVRKRT